MKSCQHQAMYTMFMVLIELGNYASIIEDFNQVFDKHVYLVDGDLIVHNPNEEFSSKGSNNFQVTNIFTKWIKIFLFNQFKKILKRLLEFFELDSSLIEFEFNPDRGFYCLSKPVRYW